ncbi:MAG TPA: right-handed parallel beta-helix repeat-containing protein, partial [Pseudonocardiaceae bacterium]|nr:right-handed parallel beta-helix repeat-containing protein [Pseudonocardiaceae bacterium]
MALLATAAATVAGFLAAAPAQAAVPAVTTVVVAPDGSDQATGDLGHPVATLARAQQLARTMSGRSDVVVELTGGTYRLSAPRDITAADSGRN